MLNKHIERSYTYVCFQWVILYVMVERDILKQATEEWARSYEWKKI